MKQIHSKHGINVSFDQQGSGPALVLVHGAFSDHETNWEFVAPALSEHFTIYTVARRGRGETDASEGHTLEDESSDLVAVINSIEEPAFLLGHSYGAHVAIRAASQVPNRVRRLVLYEPAWPHLIEDSVLKSLYARAEAGDWDAFSYSFFHDVLLVPREELDAVKNSELWSPILADAKSTVGDFRALNKYHFDAEDFSELRIPVMLQIGSESPRHLYATDVLHAALPNARIEVLAGQAHEGMTTGPDQYVRSVVGFLSEAALEARSGK